MFIKARILQVLRSRTTTCATAAKLMFVMLVLLATTITALTQREVLSGTQVRLCVKDNGQLRMITGTACDSSERLTEWVVGGQVTEIQLGQGLIGNRENGTMSLALDPSFFESCIGCGKIIAGFNDGPLELPLFPFSEEGLPPIAKLQLPAGNYAISAKLVVTAKQAEELPITRKEFALCRLSAGGDFDNSTALLEVEDDRPIQVSINDEVVLTLEVVHRFAEAGEAVLACSKGPFAGSPPMEVRNLKIVAIEGASISNSFLGGN